MQINISTLGTELLEAREKSLRKKLLSLRRYSRRFGKSPILNIILKKDTHHQTGDIYFIQANLSVPGKDISCEVKGGTIEEASDKLYDTLKDLIIEKKKTRESKLRKLARKVKDKLRFLSRK